MGWFSNWRRRKLIERMNKRPPELTEDDVANLADAFLKRYGFTPRPVTDAEGYVDLDEFDAWLAENTAALERLKTERPKLWRHLQAIRH